MADMSVASGLPDGMGQFTMPQTNGMFGGGAMSPMQAALTAFSAGLLARTRPGMSQAMMSGLNEQRLLGRQAQMAMLQSNLEFSRQMALAQQQAKLRLMYPDDDFAQSLYQGGMRPGTPEWTKAMQTRVQNELDPAVVTPQGMMLRSQITQALQPPSAPVGGLSDYSPGGPTQPASGGFLGAPYAPIGPYNRY